jgi:histidyl-tRNA synthetase
MRMSTKPNTPKGMRDFLPHEVMRRNHIMGVMKTQFERYGFLPIETPAMERRELLLGKYGDEGDRLVFKVLNSGEKVKKADLDALDKGELSRFGNSLSDKALRYDLTVPFARFVVQHQNELSFPFKRYQMQPVWRADRPQHGRFQEFTQCDADAIGSDSLLLELEFIQMIDAIFGDLQLSGCTLRINHRKVLEAIAKQAGAGADTTRFFTILDKLDKVGWEEVKRLLLDADFDIDILDKINVALDGKSTADQLDTLRQLLGTSDSDHDPVQDLSFLFSNLAQLNSTKVVFDWTLARGLDYYTGIIFEISAPEQVSVGSIGAGGRYDDLTGVFGMKDMSGIGISFGLDRIELVLSELDLFPTALHTSIDVMVVNFSMDMITSFFPYISELRKQGKRVFVYPSAAKLKKQLGLANQLQIPHALIMGESEWKAQSCTLKDLRTGEQSTIPLDGLTQYSWD